MTDICKACGELQSDVSTNILFHPFPVDVGKRALWDEKCREGDIFDSSSVGLKKGQNWAICSRHFLRADYVTINDDIHILRPNAVPSTFRRKEVTQTGQQIIQPDQLNAPRVGDFQSKDYYRSFDSVEAAHNWKNRCRVCGKLWANSVLLNLFGEKGQSRRLASKINTHMAITVSPEDSYPTKVCKPCITKLSDFQDFYDLCKKANLEFRSEESRFRKAKQQEAQEKLALEKKQQLDEEEASTANQPDSRRRARKSNPALGSLSPIKRGSALKKGPVSKKQKRESSDEDDYDDLDIVEELEEKYDPETPSASQEASSAGKDPETTDEVIVGSEEIVFKNDSRHREGTQRFNLRIAPKRNVNLPFPLMFITTRQPATPAILKPKQKSPEPPRNQIRLPDSLYPRRTRRRGPKDRKPRSKRYFVTRSRYGNRIINQTCDSPNCSITCDTVELYLEHKYLVHDESNFSYCKTCSQVYETKPRNVDNGHRHLMELPNPLPLVPDAVKVEVDATCAFCNKEFGSHSKLMQHRKIMHGNFNCMQCGKHFTAMSEFKKHMQDHVFTKGGLPQQTPKRKKTDKFTCELCKQKNLNFLQLNVHTLKEHDLNLQYLLCDCCNTVFYSEQLLRLHKEQQQGTDLQLCENCGGTFATINELRTHRKTCTSIFSQKALACRPCDAFIHPVKMRAHYLWHITKQQPPRCKKCLLPKWTDNKHNCKFYRCEACQLGFNGYPRYLAHKRTHVGKDSNYFCNICFADKLTGFEELVAHFKTHSPQEVKESRMKFMFQMTQHRMCNICLECVSKKVIGKHNRNKHDELIAPDLTEEEILTCPVCEEVQPDLDRYIEHRLAHKEQLLLNCQHCPLAFDNENRRSIHTLRTHSINRRATCEFCSKEFSSVQKIRVHIMRHLKYKPYVCKHPGCKASYYLVGDWRKHSMLHLGINPNVCKICNKQFMKAESLLVHNRKWHPDVEVQIKEEQATDVVYQCCKCEYQDKTEAAVLQHLERDHCDEVVVTTCEAEITELTADESNW